MSLQTSAAQTVGPYFSIGLEWLYGDSIAGPDVEGERVVIAGHVFDGDGEPVADALVEIWQANAQGKYAHPDDPQPKSVEPGFKGYARVPTDAHGAFRVHTIKPGPVPAPGGGFQAPHLEVAVFMRGLLRHLVTRIYFPDEAANARDLVLSLVPEARRSTLIARRHASDAHTLEWNVVLQGDDETVFFDY